MRLLITLSFVLLFLSCKKDKLTDEKEIFIGTWDWVFSRHTFNYCDGDPNSTEIITPETEGVNYSLMFLEKGIVEFYENEILQEKVRTIFGSFDNSICGFDVELKDFNFYVNRKAEKNYDTDYIVEGCVGMGTLIIKQGFPYPAYAYPEIVDGCDYYTSYFTKE